MDGDGDTALTCAVLGGHFEVDEILLNHNLDINKSDLEENTALHLAAIHGYEKIVEVLLRRGAEVDAQVNDGCSAFQFAAQNGHLSAFKLLLQYNANLEVVDADGDTALTSAAQSGSSKVIEVLLGHNANIAVRDLRISTALRSAAKGVSAVEVSHAQWLERHRITFPQAEDNINTIKLLLGAGADINAIDCDGKTPLMRAAARYQDHRSTLEYLIQNGANVNARDKNGCTCMHYVYNEEALEVFMEHKLDLNVQDFSGQTPILRAMFDPIGRRTSTDLLFYTMLC